MGESCTAAHPRPWPCKAKVGHPGLGAASSRDGGDADGSIIGVLKAGCPTFELADGKRKVRGAVLRVDKGVQPAKPCVALATEERLCHVPHGSSVCLYRLHWFDGR